eukprot:NODE_1742_length_1422_cov_29.075018_g1572_i0.p1 GENE.NODE_1742_length_1422_cov_29.075018_g1572_i0~~NODE_1742_length_1422_cov_29.075018_g1572_i0.p1  ORF type:complete len:207 (-),score=27.21 NODE_1742_length_1422_cov_29.075018_g1572_i0:664-1284(-)
MIMLSLRPCGQWNITWQFAVVLSPEQDEIQLLTPAGLVAGRARLDASPTYLGPLSLGSSSASTCTQRGETLWFTTEDGVFALYSAVRRQLHFGSVHCGAGGNAHIVLKWWLQVDPAVLPLRIMVSPDNVGVFAEVSAGDRMFHLAVDQRGVRLATATMGSAEQPDGSLVRGTLNSRKRSCEESSVCCSQPLKRKQHGGRVAMPVEA